MIQHTQGYVTTGFSGLIYKLDSEYVVKKPKLLPASPTNDSYNLQFQNMITTEAKIYERLGQHEGVIQYHGVYDMKTGAIKLAYATQGDLSTYIQKSPEPSMEDRADWIRSIARTVFHFYSCKVLHQDIKPSNVLVSRGFLKFIDFGNSQIFELDTDMEQVFNNDELARVDLLGIGCIIYTIAAWKVFSYDYFEGEHWPSPDELPSTDGILCEDIIQKCWKNRYCSVRSLYEDVIALLGEGS